MHLDRRLMRLLGDIGSLACAAVDSQSCLSKDFVCLELPALKNGLSAGSVYLRPGSERLARARLTASYRSWLRSISACTVTSYRIEHVQAMALGPHSCRLELNISSKSRPGLFYPTFPRSDSKKVIVGMDFEDLSEGL